MNNVISFEKEKEKRQPFRTITAPEEGSTNYWRFTENTGEGTINVNADLWGKQENTSNLHNIKIEDLDFHIISSEWSEPVDIEEDTTGDEDIFLTPEAFEKMGKIQKIEELLYSLEIKGSEPYIDYFVGCIVERVIAHDE